MESASLGGIVLDSSVLIAAERRGHSIREILEQVRASQGDVDAGISVVSIAELVHGAYRAKDAARQERRLQFIERLTSDVPVYPVSLDIARRAGRIEGQEKAKGIQLLMDFSLRVSTHVVVLDRFMRDRILARGIAADKIAVIPPWSHDDEVMFDHPGRERFRRHHGLHERFVVMYAGNHSPCHPLDTLLHAARELRNDSSVAFVLVGGGSQVEKVRRFAQDNGLENILQLPYQPLIDVGGMLSAADLHVVALGDPFVGIVHPCKI